MTSRAIEVNSPAAWLVAAGAGLVASGAGLAGWTIGRDVGGIIASIAGGLMAGVLIGRARWLLLTAVVAALPMILIAAFALPDPRILYREIVQMVAAFIGVAQGVAVATGAVLGIAVRRASGWSVVPDRPIIALLGVTALASAVSWLWFASRL